MFVKALPIWLFGREKEMNVQARFETVFWCDGDCTMRITGSTHYRVFLNDKLIHYGPAPSAHGCARVDTLQLNTVSGNNRLIVESAGYNCYSYACVKQLSFIQAEVISRDKCLCATGFDFDGYLVAAREQKVIRYSFQRHFTEVWNLDRTDIVQKISVLPLDIKYLPRKSPLPDMQEEGFNSVYSKGQFEVSPDNWSIPSMQGATDNICEMINGFHLNEIETFPIKTLSSFEYRIEKNPCDLPCELNSGEYAVFECKNNTCAMMNLKYNAGAGCRFIIAFDEKLVEGRFDYQHWNNMNVVEVRSSAEKSFTNFELYGYKYFSVFVIEGCLNIKSAGIIKVINPLTHPPKLNTDDEEIKKIYNAAIESARCNSMGIFMDCPTRERAGWLCDSWFSAKADWVLSGNTNIEDDFVENYLMSNCSSLPVGMLPMCYPADHPNGNYIPQWSLWFIAQLDEYVKRNTGITVDRFRNIACDLLKYFEKYENEYGLLENLDGWNFVEWTKASDWTNGVHFPTNMLYSYTLKIIGNWYRDEHLISKSDVLKKKVIELSYDGLYFRDHAIRSEANTLICQNHISEICQYYAFMFDIADITEFGELQKNLAENFVPENNYRPDIEKVNVFTGMYMRMELMRRWKLYDKLIDEIKMFFGHMSDITGTLWETKDMKNSLNHGFTAYLAVILTEIYNDNHQKTGEDL